MEIDADKELVGIIPTLAVVEGIVLEAVSELLVILAVVEGVELGAVVSSVITVADPR